MRPWLAGLLLGLVISSLPHGDILRISFQFTKPPSNIDAILMSVRASMTSSVTLASLPPKTNYWPRSLGVTALLAEINIKHTPFLGEWGAAIGNGKKQGFKGLLILIETVGSSMRKRQKYCIMPRGYWSVTEWSILTAIGGSQRMGIIWAFGDWLMHRSPINDRLSCSPARVICWQSRLTLGFFGEI